MKALAFLSAIFCTACGAFGFSMYFPKFGAPQVFTDRLVFAGVGWEPKELICIDRKDGRALWRIETKRKAAAHRVGNELFITDGGKLLSCDLATGRTTEILDTGFDECSLHPSDGIVLIRGERKMRPALVAFRRTDWKKLWVAENVEKLNITDGFVFCTLSQRKGSGSGYKFENSYVAVISSTNGTLLWKKPVKDPWVDFTESGDHLLYENSGTIHCVTVRDGTHVASAQITTNEYVGIAIVANDTNVHVWTREGRSPFSGHVIYSLSIPNLTKTATIKPDWDAASAFLYGTIIIGTTIGRTDAFDLASGQNVWRGGQWNWNGVHDGMIYFSEMARDEKSISVNSIEVTTGERKKLFERELPAEMRPNFQQRLREHYDRPLKEK